MIISDVSFQIKKNIFFLFFLFYFFFTCVVESGSCQAIGGLVVSPFRETPVPLRQEGKLGVLGFGKRHPQFLQRHPLILKLHLVHFLGFVFHLLGESSNKKHRRENSPNRSTTNLRYDFNCGLCSEKWYNDIILFGFIYLVSCKNSSAGKPNSQYNIPSETLPKVLKKTNIHWLKMGLTYE